MELPWHHGTGVERKEAALKELASLRAEALLHIRLELRKLFLRRRAEWATTASYNPADPFVCADDAARIFEEWQRTNAVIPRAFLGAVFKNDGWEPLSKYPDHPSTQPKNHGRLLLRWTHHAPGV